MTMLYTYLDINPSILLWKVQGRNGGMPHCPPSPNGVSLVKKINLSEGQINYTPEGITDEEDALPEL